MPKSVNLIIYDVACLTQPNPENRPEEEHLLTSNKEFFRYEIDRIKKEAYDNIILAETRPADAAYKANAAIPVLQHHFQNMLPGVGVSFDPFWSVLTPDANASLDALLKETASAGTLVRDIVALAHRVANNLMNESITLHVCTSNKELNAQTAQFLLQHTDLLPTSIAGIKFRCYKGYQFTIQHHLGTVKGEGDADLSYETMEGLTTCEKWRASHGDAHLVLAPAETTTTYLAEQAEPASTSTVNVEVSRAPIASNTPPSHSDDDVLVTDEVQQREAALQGRYLSSAISLRDYIDIMFAMERKATPPSDAALIELIRQYASLDVWEEKGKGIKSRSAPATIEKIRKGEGKSFAQLAALVDSKVTTPANSDSNTKSFYSSMLAMIPAPLQLRSKTTTAFYDLLYLLQHHERCKNNNWIREQAIKMFAAKYKFDDMLDAKLKKNSTKAAI